MTGVAEPRGVQCDTYEIEMWPFISVAFIQVTPLVYFTHISITTPIASALKNYYTGILSFLEVSTDFLNHFWIQVTVSLLKRPLRNRFGSETVTNL
jgi:hypothetical protein